MTIKYHFYKCGREPDEAHRYYDHDTGDMWILSSTRQIELLERVNRTDAMTEQRYHNSIERIKAMTEEFRQAVREGDETGVF